MLGNSGDVDFSICKAQVSCEYAFIRYTIIMRCCFSVSHAVLGPNRLGPSAVYTLTCDLARKFVGLLACLYHAENDDSTDKIIVQFIHTVLFSHIFLVPKSL